MSSITDDVHEMLVAYLDGELDADATRQFEERLARDANLRRELLLLQRSWDMLDRLPRADVDAKFTRTTVEMITVAAAEDVHREQQAAPARKMRRWTVALGSLLVAGLLGYGLLRLLLPTPNAQLLRDLPILENLELYQRGVDVDFIRQLHQEKLFAEYDEPAVPLAEGSIVPAASPSVATAGSSSYGSALSATPAQRRQMLEKMSAGEKDQLLQKLARFHSLPVAQQAELRALNDRLTADPQPDALLLTLSHYREWLKALPPTDRAELLELAEDKRIARIKELKQDEQVRMEKIAQATGFSLEDEHLVLAWYRDYLVRHGAELQKKLEQDRLAANKPDERTKWEERGRMHSMFMYRAVLSAWSSDDPDMRASIVPDELNLLAKSLSPEAQAWLSSKKTPPEKSRLVADWVQFASSRNRYVPFGGRPMLSELGRQFEQRLNDPSRKELDQPLNKWPHDMQNTVEFLEKFSQELPESQLEQVDQLAPRERIKKLSQLYRDRHPKTQGNDSGPPRGFGKPPRGSGERPEPPPGESSGGQPIERPIAPPPRD